MSVEQSKKLSTALDAISNRQQTHNRKYLIRTKRITGFIGSTFVIMEVALMNLALALFKAKPVPPGSWLPDPDLIGVVIVLFAIFIAYFAWIVLRNRVFHENEIQDRIEQGQNNY